MSRSADFDRGARTGVPDPQLRIGDAERNQVAEALSRHYSDGRLDDGELKERLDRAMAAKTNGDLAGLLTDLPPLTPDTPQPAMAPRRRGTVLWVALLALLLASAAPFRHAVWLWFPGPPWLVIGAAALVVWRRSRHRRHHATADR